jgi:hypothetical protein
MPTSDYKRCLRCGETKPLDGFQLTTRNPGGHDRWCKPCRNLSNKEYRAAHRDRINAKRREDWANKPEQRRAEWRMRSIWRRYGLTVETYEEMIARGCAICGASPDEREIHMDHDHHNGKVRAALCALCNVGMGSFQDDPERLRAAADYLESHAG